MGRHSAPGDEDVDEPVGEPADAGLTLLTGDSDEARGRHARDDAVVETAAAVVDDVPAAEAAAPTDRIVPIEAASAEAAPEKPPKKESNTQADLRLLRENARVRWLVLGAVVVAFASYTLVMLGLGKLGDYAYWIWIPIVLSGVLIGGVLDWAHRHVLADDETVPGRAS